MNKFKQVSGYGHQMSLAGELGLWGGGGRSPWPTSGVMVTWGLPWTEWRTYMTKNITFAQLRWRALKILRFLLIPLNEILRRADTNPCIAVLFLPATYTSRGILHRKMCVQHVVSDGLFKPVQLEYCNDDWKLQNSTYLYHETKRS